MSFFTEDAKTRIVNAVRDVEAKSAAEIVVSVRARSDDYREIDLQVGLLFAMLTLAVVMYHPAELDEDLMPVETAAAFVFGMVLVNRIRALKRALVSKKKKAERTLAAARAHFVEAGISRTRDRSGILVFISELERAVCVVPDIGVDVEKLEGWAALRAALEAAVLRVDPAGFADALAALGPALGKMLPRRADDVNELPDAPNMGPA
jgi:putative membrane protein